MSWSAAPVYTETFPTVGAGATVLGPEWQRYDADPGNGGNGVRSSSQLEVVANAASTRGPNLLEITSENVGGEHYHGGIKLQMPRKYMRWKLRLRVDDDPDEVTSGVVLFWPEYDRNRWPLAENPDPNPAGGELDFWETFDNRDTRTPTRGFIHRLKLDALVPYTGADDEVPYNATYAGVDQSLWHTICCDWTPDEVSVEVTPDGGATTKYVLTTDRAAIPTWPMEPTIQFDAWSDTPPTNPLVTQVDYAELYDYVPPEIGTPLAWPSAGSTVVCGPTDDPQTVIDSTSDGDTLRFAEADYTDDATVLTVPHSLNIEGAGVAATKLPRVKTTAAIAGLWMRWLSIQRSTVVDANDYVGFFTDVGALEDFRLHDLDISGPGLNIAIELNRRWTNRNGIIQNVEAHNLNNFAFVLYADHLRTSGNVWHDLYRQYDAASFMDCDGHNLGGSDHFHSGGHGYNMHELASLASNVNGFGSAGRANWGGPIGTQREVHNDGLQGFEKNKANNVDPWINRGIIIDGFTIDYRPGDEAWENGGRHGIGLQNNNTGGVYEWGDVTIRNNRIAIVGTSHILLQGVDDVTIEDNQFWFINDKTSNPSTSFRTNSAVNFVVGGGDGPTDCPNCTIRENAYYYESADQDLWHGITPTNLAVQNNTETVGDPSALDQALYANPPIERIPDSEVAAWLGIAYQDVDTAAGTGTAYNATWRVDSQSPGTGGFPAQDLAADLELAFGADRSASPNTWEWTNVNDRRRKQTMSITRGRPSEAGQTEPSSFGFVLDNLDGHLTPTNAESPLHPNVRKGTPVRAWLEGATPAVYIPTADSAYISAPHNAAFNFAGAFDIRVKVQPFQWSSTNRSEVNILVDKVDTFAGNWSWRLDLFGTGRLDLLTTRDGTIAGVPAESEITRGHVASLRPMWIGAAFAPDNGSGGYDVDFYTWDDPDTTRPADITTWVPAGNQSLTVDSGALYHSTAPISLGKGFEGMMHGFELRDGINGTLVASPDFETMTAGQQLLVDAQANSWQLFGAAMVTTSRPRFAGSMDAPEMSWPLGDHRASAAETVASECWASIQAAGPLRRLSQGAKPVRSPLYSWHRHMERFGNSELAQQLTLWAYWPAEESEGATIAEPMPNQNAPATVPGRMDLTGDIRAGTDSTLLASEPLPSLEEGKTGRWSATVGDPGAAWFADQWNTTMVFKLGKTPTGEATIHEVTTSSATHNRYRVTASSGTVRVRVQTGASTVQTIAVTATDEMFGGWCVLYLQAVQNGADIDVLLNVRPIDHPGTTFTATAAVIGQTLERPTAIGPVDDITADEGGFSFGHVSLFKDRLSTSWLDQPASGHIGETAAARFRRVCQEEGIAGEVVGDYFIGDGSRHPLGDETASPQMGPQLPGTFLEVAQRCVAIDGGVLSERATAPGLRFRLRSTMTAQTSRLALTGQANYLRPGLSFSTDDLGFANSVTVTAEAGSSATATNQTSINESGLYETDIKLNSVGGVDLKLATTYRATAAGLVTTQNATLADRLLVHGLVTDPRWRRVAAELSVGAELLPAWHLLALGDVISLDSLPAQWTAGTVLLVVEHITEVFSPQQWTVTITAAPAAGYSPAPV